MIARLQHQKIARILIPFLLISALTGLTYRIGRVWFGMSNETGSLIRSIHDGRLVGEWFSPFYVLLTGLGLAALVFSGFAIVRGTDRSPRGVRGIHRLTGMILALPLLATALTGLGFRVTQSWFGWSKSDAQWLLDIHQGTAMFGKDHRVWYVVVVGLGLFGLLISGWRMLPRRR